MSDPDIRWEQRFSNFNRALSSEIEELPLPYTGDLSLFRQIENPALVDHIERIGTVFYAAQAGKGRAGR